jgi:hypothetical protein
MPAQDRVQAHADSYLAELRADVRAGLTAEPKSLPPRYFYDERGSELFEEITRGGSGTGAVSAGYGAVSSPRPSIPGMRFSLTRLTDVPSPSAFGLPAPGPERPGRDDDPIKDDQAHMVRG